MSEGKTLAEVCAAMLAEYEVSQEDNERDVLRLAEELRSKQLINCK